MDLTESETARSITAERTTNSEVGSIMRWIMRDPLRAIASVLIVVSLFWRTEIAGQGYLAFDDFAFASRAASTALTSDFLLDLHANHLMPAGMLITWLITRTIGLAYWPYLLLLIIGQAVLSVAFYRLLRLLFRPNWGLLIPLCLLLFSPLTLEVTSWWAVGVTVLAMQLSMVFAIGAQVKYVRTRHKRHLATLALSVVFGLLFFEKSLLVVALVFLLTVCFFATGGPVRSIIDTARRYWPSWLVLTVVSLAYLGIYLSRAQSSLRSPTSVTEVLTYLGQLVGFNVIPGLFGGPWRWLDAEDGAAVAAPPDLARWLAWGVFLILIIASVWVRRWALRAWALLAMYLALVAGLLAATRLGGTIYSGVAGLVPRYIGDAVVVAALCIGAVLLGVVGNTGETRAGLRVRPAVLRGRGAVGAALAVTLAVLLGAAWSGARFADDWRAKQGRDYLLTAKAELAAAPPDTVFVDGSVPPGVMVPLFAPYNLQSRFFRPLFGGPVFVVEDENPSMFDDTGRIRRVRVDGTNIKPGPDECLGMTGVYKITAGKAVRMPLATARTEWQWVVRVAYISSGDSAAVMRVGDATREFRVKRGLHEHFLVMVGGGNEIELTVTDQTVTLCTNDIAIGNPVPQLPD